MEFSKQSFDADLGVGGQVCYHSITLGLHDARVVHAVVCELAVFKVRSLQQ